MKVLQIKIGDVDFLQVETAERVDCILLSEVCGVSGMRGKQFFINSKNCNTLTYGPEETGPLFEWLDSLPGRTL